MQYTMQVTVQIELQSEEENKTAELDFVKENIQTLFSSTDAKALRVLRVGLKPIKIIISELFHQYQSGPCPD